MTGDIDLAIIASVDSTYRVAIRLSKEEARKFARDILKGVK